MPTPGATSGWRIVLLTVAPAVAHDFTLALRAQGHDVVAMVVPAGVRGLRPLDMEGWAELGRLFEAAPPSVDVLLVSERAHLTPRLAGLKPDLLLCFFFPWRLPPEALALPRLGAVNVHPSLLPRYRGPCPLGWALREDARELGLTFHRMDASFDTGPVLAQGMFPVKDEDTEEVIFELLMLASRRLLPGVVERVARGDVGERQVDADATLAPFFEPAYRDIDWCDSARSVHLKVRACRFAGWREGRGDARALLQGHWVRVQRTRAWRGEDPHAQPGTLLARQGDELLVQCGDTPLWVVSHAPEVA
ncbi:methionyl-tRNA formyltransferase [Corallococcus coralloides DSM 2259]|uniref:Methionyl-tRNA formyltransferase n=1 Tax=Corallococcus coralloides (strain ATCC 25202 / DSM 2259 / NBRC 100086 / M2) TaxID=1144275 RepID=H8MH82_CORCM|nr:formyltransferase family protein [Corallococcus coralloides]AFE08805.1 methionyl-tRNA formyltransferase [Corallococcus coralloides DSM 2259]